MEITSSQNRATNLEATVSPEVSVKQVDKVALENLQINQLKEGIRAEEPKESGEPSKQAGNLQVAVSQINDYVQNLQRNLQFTVDEVTGKDIVTVIDSESKEVIRQLPSEEALQLARRLEENKEAGVQLISTQV